MKHKSLIILMVFHFCFQLPVLNSQTVKDIDGNVYKTVTIGKQVWMAENLKTTKFNDGSSIPLVKDFFDAWEGLTTPGYCWADNDVKNKAIYGALYNWYTVNTNKLCPKGWHVPTEKEWAALTDYLTNNGYGNMGSGTNIAKSMAYNSGWKEDLTAGNIGNEQEKNNSSGFSGKPGGYRGNGGGAFQALGEGGFWWSSTEFSKTEGCARGLGYKYGIVSTVSHEKSLGIAVRCMQDF